MPSSAYSTSSSVTTPPESTAIVAPEFIDIAFPVDVAEGATGGLQFSTIVCVKGNGLEQRVPLYSLGRYRWNAGPGIKSPSQMALVTAFFAARRGKAYGFRWKDWDDFEATAEPFVADGSPYAQLIKTYSSGGVDYERTIFAPVSGEVAIERNASLYAAWTVDNVTGVITWAAIIQKNITAITAASSAVITVGASHGFVNGDVVYITSVVGMTEINDQIATVTATAATTITVNINSTTYTAWSSGGTVTKYVQPADDLTWTGEFDVPVRFDTDEMLMTQESTGVRVCNQLPVIELTGE